MFEWIDRLINLLGLVDDCDQETDQSYLARMFDHGIKLKYCIPSGDCSMVQMYLKFEMENKLDAVIDHVMHLMYGRDHDVLRAKRALDEAETWHHLRVLEVQRNGGVSL